MCSKQPGREQNLEKSFFLFFSLSSLEVSGTFYSLGMLYKAVALIGGRQPFKGNHLQMTSDLVDLDTFGKILTSYF